MYLPGSPFTSISLLLLLCPLFSAAESTLKYFQNETRLTIKYTTTEASGSNWIGLYDEKNGGLVPQLGEKYSHSAINWQYAPGSEGTVDFETSRLHTGRYTCFFHGPGSYSWLADPLEVYYTAGGPTDVQFITSEATLKTAIRGQEYVAAVDGLLKDFAGTQVSFGLSGTAPSWLNVSADGSISGTPTDSTKDTTIVVEAFYGTYSDTVNVTIPVRSAGSAVEKFHVISFNTWFGGTYAENYHDKQIKFIIESGADIIGLQEDHTGENVARLGHALSWDYWASGSSVSILSKYPIDYLYGSDGVVGKSGGVRLNLDGKSQYVNFWSAHLSYKPYGPYDFCFEGMTQDQVMKREISSGRVSEMEEILTAMEPNIKEADDVPVFLVGDFNAPSHLDWKENMKDNHCGYYGMQWPTSVKPIEAGLIDSFREKHPDPIKTKGITYSPITEWNDDYEQPEPRDRIDFIYYKGSKLELLDSQVYMTGKPGYILDDWTSDHAAVMTTYKLST